MRIRCTFMLFPREGEADVYAPVLRTVNMQPDTSWLQQYTVKVWQDSWQYEFLRAAVEEHGLNVVYLEEKVYSDRDLQAIELIHLIITAHAGSGYDHRQSGLERGPRCPVCRTPQQVVPIPSVNKAEMGTRDLATTYQFHYLMSGRLAAILEAEGCRGYTLREVPHRASRGKWVDLPVYQIIAAHTLPKLAPPTSFKMTEGFCAACEKQGFSPDSEFFYSRDGLTYEDINFTAEFFGWVNTSPSLIVSNKVFKLLRRQKVRNLKPEPVHLL